MRVYSTDMLRNVALVGHQGCGKTTLVEAMLFNTGAVSRQGRVDDKNTVADWDDDERERGLSLSTSVVPVEFADCKINVLDAPGVADFQGDIKNAIRVADSVFVVVDAVAGVEVGTELVWGYAEEYAQPIVVTINKLDRENASFGRTLAQLRERFPAYKFVPVMLPIGEQGAFEGVVNLLTMKAYFGAGADRADLPASVEAAAAEARAVLVEAAAEAIDVLMEKYFSDGDLSRDEIRDGMRAAARDDTLKTVPVFATSGQANIGTVPLMEALTVYVSPPSQRRVRVMQPDGTLDFLLKPQTDDGPLAAYVFKTVHDRYGTQSYVRVFRGALRSDSRVFNSTRSAEERVGALMVLRGKDTFPVDVLHAGDVGMITKLAHTVTGDTLAQRDHPHQITRPDMPAPLYAVALTPRTQADSAKMGTILSTLASADPTLRWRLDPDTKETVLEGMGGVHVDVAVKRAERLGLGLDVHMPRVPYRETITGTGQAQYRHKKQTGGAGQFAEVHLRVEPNPGGGFVYETRVVGGVISHTFLPSIEKGIAALLPQGVLAGYPISDVRVIVVGGQEHPVDSKDIAFQIAGREGFKEAFSAAGPVLLEPTMDVAVTVPDAMMGDVLGDLNNRRGRVTGIDTDAGRSVVRAVVPLAEMLRYGDLLRAMTGGRGLYTMQLAQYEQVPAHLMQGVIAAHRAAQEVS